MFFQNDVVTVLGAFEGYVGFKLGSCWGNDWVMLRSSRGHDKGILGSFWCYVGVILGSFWNRCWVTCGSCGSHAAATLGSIQGSVWGHAAKETVVL